MPRPEGAVDAFEWYCPNCHNLVHRAEVQAEEHRARPASALREVLRQRGSPDVQELRHHSPRESIIMRDHRHACAFFPGNVARLRSALRHAGLAMVEARLAMAKAMVMLGDREFRRIKQALLGPGGAAGRAGSARRGPAGDLGDAGAVFLQPARGTGVGSCAHIQRCCAGVVRARARTI